MGWRFSLQAANTVAWLTAPPTVLDEISVDLAAAHDLFMGIASKPSPKEMEFVSHDPMWLEQIYDDCREYSRSFKSEGAVEADVKRQLSHFRGHFGDINLFVLGIPRSWEETRQLGSVHAFVMDGAHSSGSFGLFLLPEDALQATSILAPFPAFGLLSSVQVELPGALFWTPQGKAAFCNLDEARNLYHRIRPVLQDAAAVGNILDDFMREQTRAPVLLHLSDLHFGTERARDSQNYLLQAIEQVARERKVARIVITGDLFDNPRREHEVMFVGFRQRLHAIVGSDPIVIPGNHDQRAWLGMFRKRLRQAADLEWASIVADDSLKMVFICFDSSKDGTGARGRVSEAQRLDVAAAFESFMNRNAQAQDYLRLALVHHHPFSFDLPTSGWWKILARLGFTEEDFLRMDDADEFVKWCASREASLILHGHKHVPYSVAGEVWLRVGSAEDSLRRLPSIGCGSSTGVGNQPMSMNLLTWIPSQRRWAASFLIDPGDGRGFAEQRVEINTVTVT